MEKKFKLPGKNDLREVPSNKTIESVVVDVKVTNWLEILGSDKLIEEQKKGNFENSEKQIIVVVKTDSQGFIREEKFTLYPEVAPTNRSKYGKFVTRYDKAPEVGMKVQVDFDGEGKSQILLSK